MGAGAAAGELYGYGHHNVLFKPTKATKHPFRPTGEVAMSYFVGADAMGMDEFKGEDAGFAINGGKGWSKVVFTNHQIDLNGNTAPASRIRRLRESDANASRTAPLLPCVCSACGLC